jgi:hypothetical protein
MKRALKQILEEPCKNEPIEFSEALLFSSQYSNLQRYNSGIKQLTDSQIQNASLPTKYKISKWIKSSGKNIWTAERLDTEDGKTKDVDVFVKTVHLLNPISYIKGDYVSIKNALLPCSSDKWKDTLMKINSQNNQAYIDNMCAFVLSRFRELDFMPHFVLYYGSMTGICNNYKYGISDEYETYRNYRWFWRGIKEKNAKLEMNPENADLVDFVLTCPFNEKELEEDDTESELSSLPDLKVDETAELESVTSFESQDISESQETSECQDEAGSTSSGETEEVEYDVFVHVPEMPVTLIYQEAHEGTMDELLDVETLDGCKVGSKAWEARWIAWIWQIISALAFLQRSIGFTHNDLHTNNIVWRKTNIKYLYYRTSNGKYYKVPTYGKIFAIIDFGRAIFHIGNKHWLSDDFLPNEDAGGQYNYGPIYDKNYPKVTPNYSFDLCRLAISLIDGLFSEKPEKSKLYDLLFSWTLDNEGETVYESDEEEEKYSGFKLYMKIASDCFNAVPREQLQKDIFKSFEIDKSDLEKDNKVYHIV